MNKAKKNKKDKRNLLLLFLILFAFGIGLGYAVLSQQLQITNTVKYDSMKWNVGFDSAVDNGGSVNANPQISSDKKTMTIACDLGLSVKSETCIVKTTIKNDSTFDIVLSADPTVTSNDTYINTVETTWITTTSNTGSVKQNDVIPAGAEYEVQIVITTKTLNEDLLPSSPLSIPVTVTMNWVEKE